MSEVKDYKFPRVKAKSPAAKYGVDEGTEYYYDRSIGMYVTSSESEEVGPGAKYSWFREQSALSPSLINALLESGVVEKVDEVSDEATTEANEEKKEIETWDKADLFMTCGRCGAKEFITTAYGAATIYVPTNDEAMVRLVCQECGNQMMLSYSNGAMMTEEEKEKIKAQQAKIHGDHASEGDKEPAKADGEPLKSEKPKDDEPQEKSE